MTSEQGAQLAQVIRGKIDELAGVCEGLNEKMASTAPGDRWSPKEVLSHLYGGESVGIMPPFWAMLEEDTPRLDLDTGNAHFTEGRSKMAFAQLLTEVKDEYYRLADFIAGLTEEQLSRKAYMPMLKETPFGEYPTVAVFASLIGELHMSDHITHMTELVEALRKQPSP